eukprot:1114640-Amphidinium_carterae.1
MEVQGPTSPTLGTAATCSWCKPGSLFRVGVLHCYSINRPPASLGESVAPPNQRCRSLGDTLAHRSTKVSSSSVNALMMSLMSSLAEPRRKVLAFSLSGPIHEETS